MPTIAEMTGEQFGFCVVPESEFIKRKLYEARWELVNYPFLGMHADLYCHIIDTLGWIPTHHGSLLNVPFDKPMIATANLPIARKVFGVWVQPGRLRHDG